MAAMASTNRTNNVVAFTIKISGSGVPSVNSEYEWRTPDFIPKGFASVCVQNQWNIESMWKRLNGERKWLHASNNDAYIYLNSMDNQWWIDEPNGSGVFIAPGNCTLSSTSQNICPPKEGWKALGLHSEPLPTLEIIINDK